MEELRDLKYVDETQCKIKHPSRPDSCVPCCVLLGLDMGPRFRTKALRTTLGVKCGTWLGEDVWWNAPDGVHDRWTGPDPARLQSAPLRASLSARLSTQVELGSYRAGTQARVIRKWLVRTLRSRALRCWAGNGAGDGNGWVTGWLGGWVSGRVRGYAGGVSG